jgi:hypothetical protein
MARRYGACSLKWITGVMGWWLAATGKPALQSLPLPCVLVGRTSRRARRVVKPGRQGRQSSLNLCDLCVLLRLNQRPVLGLPPLKDAASYGKLR